jgi:DNA polymerase-3 subunit epsilon
MQREIVFDTETTGLDPARGDRLIEIGCIEIINRIPTGREFHHYINPERDVHPDAVAVHGLTQEFLKDKPLFIEVCDPFLAFIGDAPLVAHNGTFDLGFINAELARLQKPGLPPHRIVDTLQIARRKHPAGPNSLDALCKRYGIDNTKRTKHGALMDAALLAQVYVELLGERQATLGLAEKGSAQARANTASGGKAKPRPEPLAPRIAPEQIEAHRAFVGTLGAEAVWLKYYPPAPGAEPKAS